MRGTVRKITLPRRLVADLMHASTRVPFVSLTRPLNVRGLLEARAQAAQRPGWAAIFVKAFAMVAKEQPVLRTLYVKWPMPAFYELPRSVAMVAIARIEDGQVVFKAEIGSITPLACQVQGVWVRPDLRGRGLAAAGMAAVVTEALRNVAPVVSLYVNDFNAPARAAYRRVGFTETATFASVLF